MVGAQATAPLFSISLAQWSLHRALQSGELDPMEFAAYSKKTFDIDAVEYVNSFLREIAPVRTRMMELATRSDDAGVRNLLIMVDGEGNLGDADAAARKLAVENHHRWADAAMQLGCHSIRVNAAGAGEPDEVAKRVAESLRALADYAAAGDLNVIVENHGGLSSNGAWLAGVMRQADHPRVGTLPDFGNFHLGDGEWYDRYDGVRELMPFAKAVSAKTHDFDDAGECVETDYARMLKIVMDAGYHGRIGIEYEGSKLTEVEGIQHTKALLERVREQLS